MYIMNFFAKLPHYGDILAIPFFMLMFAYFYKIKIKNTTEYLLLFFSFMGVMADLLFTLLYFRM